MSSPPGTVELAVTCLSIIGALAVSYVESCIISKSGPMKPGKDLLADIYWRNLGRGERVLFWTGTLFLISPFLVSALG